ncbi:GAF and ANTAR domain-containing protein [Arthrobacter oryzae]|uniref:GAF and ANTAR domain-containing protein n=1 Tax=Arthrobacter oryzae TaxID=409290 RepID=UPI0030C9D673
MAEKLPLDELSGAIGRIRRLLLTEEKVDAAVELLAKAIKDSVPGTIGAGVSVMDSQGRRTSHGATDRVVEEADALQYELGEGPCLTAWAAEESILVDDVRTDDRWPRWREAVRGLPIRSVVSTALVADKESVGALKIYAALPSAYTPATVRLLELFAAPAATLLSHVQGSDVPRLISDDLHAALESRDMVNRACGILMQRHGLGHERALEELMRQARRWRLSLAEAAVELIAAMPADGN